MKKVISLKMLITFFLIVFCIQDSASAQQNKIEALQTKVEKLQQKVSQLESKVERLEKLFLSKKDTSASFQRSVNSDRWENKQNWRRLKRGMSKEEVRQILDEPHRIIAHSSGDTWDYPGLFGGSVYFDDNGRVESWSEPMIWNP